MSKIHIHGTFNCRLNVFGNIYFREWMLFLFQFVHTNHFAIQIILHLNLQDI